MHIRPLIMALTVALAMPLAACGGTSKTMAEDIQQFDALANKTINKEAAELGTKMRAAKNGEERAKFLKEFSQTVDKQGDTLAGYKADHPEVKAVADKVSGGLKKVAAAARKGETAFAKEDQAGMSSFGQEMNVAMSQVQQGATDFKKLAQDNKVDISF